MQIPPVSLDSLLPAANAAAPPATEGGGGFARSLRERQDALATPAADSAAQKNPKSQSQSSSREGELPQNRDNSLSAEKGASSRGKSIPATKGQVPQKAETLQPAGSQPLPSAPDSAVEAKALFTSVPQVAESPLADGSQLPSPPEALPPSSQTSPATVGVGHFDTPDPLVGVPETTPDPSPGFLAAAAGPPVGKDPKFSLNKEGGISRPATESSLNLPPADVHSVSVADQSSGSPLLKGRGGRENGSSPPIPSRGGEAPLSSAVTEEVIVPLPATTFPKGAETPANAPVLEKADPTTSAPEPAPEIDLASAQTDEGISLPGDRPGLESVVINKAGALPAASPRPEPDDVTDIPGRATAQVVEPAAPTVASEDAVPEPSVRSDDTPVVVPSPRTENDEVSIPERVTAQVVESAIPPVAGQSTGASIPNPVRPVAGFTGGDANLSVERTVENPEMAAPHGPLREAATPEGQDVESALAQRWPIGERADAQKVAMSEPQPQPSGNKAVVPPTFSMGERGAEVIESLRVALPQSPVVQSSPSASSTPTFDPISASAVAIPPEMTTPLRLREDFRGQRLDTSSDRRFAQLLGETRGAVRVSVAQGESLPVMDAGKGEGAELLFREPGAQVESGIFRVAADNGGSNPTVFSVAGQGGATPQAASAGSGTPAVATPFTLPVPEEEVYQQVASRLTLVNGERHSRMTMRLYPEELGQVKLDLTVEGDRVRVQMHAQNQQVQEVLEKYLPRLRESFEQQGLKLEEAQVTYDSPGQGGRGSFQESRQSFFAARSAGRSTGRTAGEEEPVVTLPPSSANPRPGGISVRV